MNKIYIRNIKDGYLKNFDGEQFCCDRTTPLGNKFVVGVDGNRKEVIEKYRKDFKNLLNNNFSKKMFEEIKNSFLKNDIVLMCWCKPLDCHCEVIRDAIIKEVKNGY